MRNKKRGRTRMQWICLLCAILVVIMIWVILYDTHHFIIVKKEFYSDKIRQQKRFVMLSDLHNKQYGKENAILLESIDKLHPDGILIAGDMITALKKEKFDSTILLLEKLKEKYPVYYANGNHEQKIRLYPKQYGTLYERYKEELDKIGIEPLQNARVTLWESGIEIIGSEINHNYYKRFKQDIMPEKYLNELLGEKDEKYYTILLAHNPEYFSQYVKWGADLIFSGHVHGGIARLPFLGGVVSPSLRLFPKYDGGIFEEGKSVMVLGRGIGTHSPNIRVFNPGELIVVDLYPHHER